MNRHYCGLINKKKYINKYVNIYGWVINIRILKKVIFLILNDYTGSIQLVIFKKNINLWKICLKLTIQSCIRIIGKLVLNIDKNLEILVKDILLLNISCLLPLDLYNIKNNSNVRFKYRYLDFRNKNIFKIFKIRSDVNNIIHNFFYKNGFLNIETPFLTKSSPEGARDFIVPSRIYSGKFYSLPQSPQIFKQLLMIGGFDKYYQVVKCFRDEDFRSNRQPEFTQLDVELSFENFNFIKDLINNLIYNIWYKILNIKLNNFLIIKYNKCLLKYGTDKPDLRNPLNFDNKIYKYLLKNNFILNFIKNKIILEMFIFKDNIFFDFNYLSSYFLNNFKIKYLFYIKINNFIDNIYYYEKSNNFFDISDNLLQKILFNLKPLIGGIYFIFFFDFLNYLNLLKIRTFFCNYFKLYKDKEYFPVWIIDFPMFFKNKFNNLDVFHHPFTNIKADILDNNNVVDYLKLISTSYDLVINGHELGSGSERINNYNLQVKIFDILGISKKNQILNYGFFLESLKYGTPPHIGLALGLDRLLMLLTKKEDIKEVIAFPKSTSGICFLTGSPCF